ncbi:hypothetical protein BHE74_00046035 [Ensete ventricosum]|nr:hypothetical protein BHE74_00046035 [Ensete ventricosum]
MARPPAGVAGHGQPPCMGSRLRPRRSAGAVTCKRRHSRPRPSRKGQPLVASPAASRGSDNDAVKAKRARASF